MSTLLRIWLVVFISVFMIGLVFLLKKKRLNLKYTLLWFVLMLVLLILTLFPGLVDILCRLTGIVAPTNLIFSAAFVFVLLILVTLTVIVSKLTNQIYNLTQHIARMEKRIRDLEASNNSEK